MRDGENDKTDSELALSRRQLLAAASASALWFAAHAPGVWGERPPSSAAPTEALPRILGLRLATATPLAEMREFYHRRIGFSVLAESAEELTLAAGKTLLTFYPAEGAAGQPFYHFAFNIPENKAGAACRWQQARSEVIPQPEIGGSRDSSYPPEVVHFQHWNAHSVFFNDPAGNLVEYIARHDLGNAAAGDFSTADILHASEIGFISADVPSAAAHIQKALDLPQYRQGSEKFRALGDEHGLLLVIYRGRRWGTSAAERRPTDIYPTEAHVRGSRPRIYEVPRHPYVIRVKSSGRVTEL